MSDEAREIHPWARTFRNTDNATGPDFRPQFVTQDMPYAEDLEETPYGGLTVEEVGADESGGEDGPKDSTVTVSVASLQPKVSSPEGASPSSEGTTASAGSVEPGVKAPEL